MMIKNRNILIFLFLFFFQNGIDAIRYPVNPQDPSSPDLEDNESSSKLSSEKEKKKKNRVYITAHLGSGDMISGYIEIPREITFQHYKNGFVYKKSLNTKEIKSIVIENYTSNPTLDKKNKIKKPIFFKYIPSRVIVKTIDGNTFELTYLFPFFHKFLIENDDGSTWLFTIFGDEFYPKTGWKEAQNDDIHYHNHQPHPKAVKKIYFQTTKGGF